MLFYQSWHIHNALFDVAEIMPIKSCFYRIFPQIFFISFTQALDLLIAIDRFMSVKCPLIYSAKKQSYYSKYIAVAVTFAFLCCTLSFFDIFPPSDYLTYCSSRVGFGKIATYLLWFMALLLASTTVLIYCMILIFACLKTKNTVAPTSTDNNSAQESLMKTIKKLTQASIVSGTCYFVVGPANVIVSLLLKVYSPELALIVGQYISMMFFSSSVIYFVNLFIFVSDFRASVKQTVSSWIKL